MTADLRHLAIILNQGARKANEYQDAALASALSAMSEVAVGLHEMGGRGELWDVEAEYEKLAERLR